MSGIPIFQVDAFTSRPFRGNPAAVCLLKAKREDSWLQDVAREMNLSETAFLVPQGDFFHLRWFTPACEVELCGHATLASAHILYEEKILKSRQQARFHTLGGPLFASRKNSRIELDFPVDPVARADGPRELTEALGCKKAVFIGRGRFDYLVELSGEQELRSLKPDFRKLAVVTTRGIIVTCRAESGEFDFISRFFAPAYGIDEDPVTGSAHCALAPYWADKLGKEELTGFQASARGGVVQVRLGEGRVYLGGEAVTVLRGTLLD
ncbi:MAG: oxidoreductase [Candidatus Glassbacteria bacterium RIFCSPLOWO2_12_FULL_58_11]|uniref:Oxidoreductase n=1 Tax=Candidatus Glassbacteria bacterium RIFCSPLOWO2_12_FULL_58_11 TaxID=1817867 RepID=A0A1F5YT61_9BACT|nr:MAG: oxidoreductase [Candidatus Glassbacteria bacterium RIFCSPLOWO2_12_FULL_58_11]